MLIGLMFFMKLKKERFEVRQVDYKWCTAPVAIPGALHFRLGLKIESFSMLFRLKPGMTDREFRFNPVPDCIQIEKSGWVFTKTKKSQLNPSRHLGYASMEGSIWKNGYLASNE